MELSALLFAQCGLRITGIRITPAGATLLAEALGRGGCCPNCGRWSARVHSHHTRRTADLPAHGRAIWLELHLRRFFCDNSSCPQVTFVEPIPQVAIPYAHKTMGLVDALADIAFSTGGEAGARLAGELGMPASPDTLLRLLRQAAVLPVGPAPQVLGADDFALRRSQVYGTILCDLQKHRPVDLLPERSSTVFAAWLKEHPGADIISRDRGGDYAKGAREGAPGAIQVADRWHLLHNMTDAFQTAVDSRHSLLSEVTKEVNATMAPAPTPVPTDISPAAATPSRLSRADQKKQQSRERRLVRYQQVQELRRQGMGIRKIARTLKMDRKVVERFATCQQFPERATPTPRPMAIDAYLPYLKQRWEEGCDNVAQLWQEIKAKGFAGSVYMVRRQVRRWRRAAGRCPVRGPQPIAVPRMIQPSARRIAWLALGHVREPTAQDELILKAIYRRWPQLQESAELCRQFAAVLKEHDTDALEAWMQLAQEPGILPTVRRFAEVLRQDWAAVVEAVRQPWSQGQVEGQINRLKLIKRQMYGRGNFDLLRQRVLHQPIVRAQPA